MALLLEYEGTAYGGSQHQINAPTIQGSLERALSRLTSESIRVAFAGRTDAGVHAKGQVASFLTTSRHTVETFVRGLNALLPEDVAVRAATEVDVSFNPRRQAVTRRYRYTISLRNERPVLLRRFVWHTGPGLDLGEISKQAALLPGRHDFAAFTPPAEAARRRTERLVTRSRISESLGLVHFEIEANSFLPHMVRRLAGTLVEVGRGRLTGEEFRGFLEKGPAGAARWTAPGRGLCLMKVRYESGLFDEADEDL